MLLNKLTTALLLCFCTSLATAQTQSPKITKAAEWKPNVKVFQTMASQCMNAPNRDECKAKSMQQAGAPAQAIAFSRLTGYDGYLRSYRKIGPVDVAYVTFPLRANENDGVLLVNGDPITVDVDDYNLMPKDDLKADLFYATLLQSNPDLMVFPGDRSSLQRPVSEKLSDGGQRFLVLYRLQTCHACAQLGEATLAFNFSPTGKFDGVKVWAVNAGGKQTSTSSGGAKPVDISDSHTSPVELTVGQPLNLTLAANPTTGYQWQLAAPVDQNVLKFTSSRHSGPQSAMPGAGGQQILGFTAAGQGKTTISLKYVRPWETNTPPAKTVVAEVVVK
jgi:predicted secreted protein